MTIAQTALHEAIEEFVHDMTALAHTAKFMEVSGVLSTAVALLNKSREANAEAYSAKHPHMVAG